MKDELTRHLNHHDGGCRREGAEMTRLVRRSGLSLETLRSVYYGRRNIRDAAKLRALRKAMGEKKVS